MNLALFGSGEFTPQVDKIDEYLITRFKPKNIAVLPTAAGLESDVSKWLDMAKLHYAKFSLPVIQVPVLNKDQANDQKLTGLLAGADWIFFSGGNPSYLLQSLENTKLWKIVMGRLNDGALLAGSSAGAMIMGKFVLTPSLRAMFSHNETFWQSAFGLVDYTVLPHFDHFKKYQGFIKKIIDKGPDKVRSSWMGIDENTAIIYGNNEQIVRGLGGVEIHSRGGTQYLKQ
jgi:peptidase E